MARTPEEMERLRRMRELEGQGDGLLRGPEPGSGMSAPMGAGLPGQGMPGIPGQVPPRGLQGQAAPLGVQAEDAPVGVSMPMQTRMTPERIREAEQTLMKYKSGKKQLEQRVIACDKWWRLRNWEEIEQGNPHEKHPVSAWLFNVLATKHADAMDSYPEANILPRERSDEAEARALKDIIPVILEQNGFKETYSRVTEQKLKTGCGIYGIFWDGQKHNGLGDITISRVNILNIFWEPGIEDIQNSENLFVVELMNNSRLTQQYPQMKNKTGGNTLTVEKFATEDNIDTTDKSLVVDWYYHSWEGGKKRLHLCKFCGDTVLYSSEDDPKTSERGFYDHGMYPFEFDPCFRMEGSPAGFGYIDICKSAQEYIDLLDSAMVRNAIMGATPRYFIRNNSTINEEEFADWTKPFVHGPESLSEEGLRQIEMRSMDGMYLNMLQHKIDEMKETAGNRDVSNGGTTNGVTAASAIAAMQEQSGKLSKDAARGSYRAYERVVKMVIELIRQFYDVQRQFRITGEMGQTQYVDYSNAGIKPQAMEGVFGEGEGYRVPEFDLEVSAQNATEYTKVSQNELALSFYNNGFFNPQMSDQALSCLEMMDFDGKYEVMQKIQQNGTLREKLANWQQMALTLAQKYEPQMAQGLAAAIQQEGGQVPEGAGGGGEAAGSGMVDLDRSDEMGIRGKEHGLVEKARARSQEATRV